MSRVLDLGNGGKKQEDVVIMIHGVSLHQEGRTVKMRNMVLIINLLILVFGKVLFSG